MDNAREFKGYNGVFAKRLREVMDENKTTQEMLAKQTGLTRQTISQYMDGSVLPNVEKLYRICSFFDIPSDYFIGFTNSKSIDISDQYMQNITGLSDEAIDTLKTLKNGRPHALFALPFDMGVINYMLSNLSVLINYLQRLSKYFVEKQEDEKLAMRMGHLELREETVYAKYSLAQLTEQMIDDCYRGFYKPSIVDKKTTRKPGRKRKENMPDNNE